MPDVTIAVTRYDEPDGLVRDAVASLAGQQGVEAEVLFLDQQQAPELWRELVALSNHCVTVSVRSIPARSLSFARNEAIRTAAADTVLFMDCDGVAAPGWAAALTRALAEDDIAVAGGRIVPRWWRPPLAIARARVAWEQYSLLDLGPGRLPVGRVVGAGFGIDRRKLGEAARFDEALGRRDGRLFSGEDSDFCLRVRDLGFAVVYEGAAIIEHQILPPRITWRWIARRLFYAGINRAVLGGVPATIHVMCVWDYVFLPLIALPYAAGFIWGRLR